MWTGVVRIVSSLNGRPGDFQAREVIDVGLIRGLKENAKTRGNLGTLAGGGE